MVVADELPNLAQPTLTIWGENDMASVGTGRAAVARMPHGTFVSFEGGGHFPFIEQPARCARLVVPFVQGASVK
jgi:pimeloyl-ACP methyl ester carboxylesterase